MIPISNKKLEMLAVSAIVNETHGFHLTPNIPVGDKGISFDGDIEVMMDGSERKESLLGKVPVQVKGTFVKKFTEGKRTFSLEIAHYKNFYSSNGVVLFVVEVNSEMETKIFFKQLLPTELRLLIKKYENQKSRSIELRPLKETNLYRVCKFFLHESKKQAPILLEKNPFNRNDYSSFRFTSLTFNPMSNDAGNIWEHDFTIYGMINELSVPIGIARIASEIDEFRETIHFNGTQIEAVMKIERNLEQMSMEIDNSLVLELDKKANFNFTIKRFKSVSTQLKLLPLLKAILTGGSIDFVNQGANIIGGKPHDNKWIETTEELYQSFLKLQSAFSKLNINLETEFTIEDDNFIQNVNSFSALIIDNDFSSVKIKEQNTVGFVFSELGGIQYTFFYNPTSNTPLTNGFSPELIESDTRIDINGETYPYSPFYMLTKEALAFSQNTDLKIIKESFDRLNNFANEKLFNFTNEFCLMCVQAYELSLNVEFLKLANYIYSKCEMEESSDSNIIIRINQLQINLRLNGSLKQEETAELIKIKSKSVDNEQVQFCTSVLLESKVEADWYFSKFKEEIQLNFKELPIFSLYEKL